MSATWTGDPSAELVTPKEGLVAVSIIDAIQRSAVSRRKEPIAS